jgi:4'-phosphopantetheinyl transferase
VGKAISETTRAVPLERRDIHVWSLSLARSSRSISVWEETLSAEEKQRAERFRFETDRAAFVKARAILRTLVGAYLQIEPAKVQFAYTSFGKPKLDPSLGQQRLRFNLSHSHGQAVYAFAHGRELGVDLEFIPPDWTSLSLAQHCFSRHENEQLQSLSDSQQKQAFFRCWTRKEAYIKALGEGLSLGLDQFMSRSFRRTAAIGCGD